MDFGPYHLLEQIGAGPDGVAYRAAGDNGDRVVVHDLTAARCAGDRWTYLSRRLRLTNLLTHPNALAMHALTLDNTPPYVVMEWVEEATLASQFGGQVPLAKGAILPLALALADVLATAHRLGLTHGDLRPETIHVLASGQLKVDFAQFATGRGHSRPVASLHHGPADDLKQLGHVLAWLATGRSDMPLPSSSFGSLIGRLLLDDAEARPSARHVADELAEQMRTWKTAPGLGPAVAATGVFQDDSSLARRANQTEADVVVTGTSRITPSNEPRRRPPEGAENDQVFARGYLGRFRLLEKLGQGGMGAVYRAEDPADGSIVALKVLRTDWSDRPDAIQRFVKEARLLAEVNNPYVANLLEVNEDVGLHYLVLEYVGGRSLGKLLEERPQIDEKTAMEIMADVARALADAHRRGIVHRDVKPDNILLLHVEGEEEPASDVNATIQHRAPTRLDTGGTGPRVKLSDFGLARHVDQSESLSITQTGAILGTPLYMSPEQCSGQAVDPRSDTYAMGATLYHLLAGRPPFVADTPAALIFMHHRDAVPDVRKFAPAASDGAWQILQRCLAKTPDARYPDASAFLDDVERLLRGEPTSIVVHPKLPAFDSKKLLQYDWSWTMDASPAQLWPYVSNTERFNRAVGLSPVDFTTSAGPDDAAKGGLHERMRRFGAFRVAGMNVAWEEHPFEWIEGRRFGVLREYTAGPFKWFVSYVELEPLAGGGTLLSHRLRLEPHGILGRTVAAIEIGVKSKRIIERVYKRIDDFVTGKLGNKPTNDPFESPSAYPAARQERLEHLIHRIVERGVDPGVVEKLGDFIAHAPAQSVARIRPLALATVLGVKPEPLLTACLHGAHEGLLVLQWDLLCPSCRIPSEVKDTLRALKDHGHCPACNINYELDFANSVELIFRAHPEVRDCELRTYCVGGPAHFPHVVAQVRIAARERIELELALTEGAYQLRGPQLPFIVAIRVQGQLARRRLDVNLGERPTAEQAHLLGTGKQVLVVHNPFDVEVLVRLERTAQRDDALTAAQASSLATFRELFPGEVLSPGQLVSVSTMTFLVTALDQSARLYAKLGDAKAFGVVHEHFRLIEDCTKREGGALVKTVGEGVLAAFREIHAAVRTAFALPGLLADNPNTRQLRLRIAVHSGPAMAATLNDHLDYFGSSVNTAWRLLELLKGGEILLSESVSRHPQVASFLHTTGLVGEIVDLETLDVGVKVGQRYRWEPSIAKPTL